MVLVPVDVSELARDQRASIASHHIALVLRDARDAGTAPDQAELAAWFKRWEHAIARVAEHGPNSDGAVVIVNGTDAVSGEDAGVTVAAQVRPARELD